RARLNVLSEMPTEWGEAVARWQALNRPVADRADAGISPEDEYLLYQTLVGIWPLDPVDQDRLDELRERVHAYMLKAMREAKLRTSWINPNEGYESAVTRFIDRLLGVREPNPFLTDLQSFVEPVARLGCINSLNQVLIKLTAPGVPDIYQGCETWQFNLVDPDNRRPVDFEAQQAVLDEVQVLFGKGPLSAHTVSTWLENPARGHVKMWLSWRLLALRRLVPTLFEQGAYRALEAKGLAGEHAVAYQRREDGNPERHAIVMGSRLLSAMDPGAWSVTTVRWVASGIDEWADWLTGRPVPVAIDDTACPRQCVLDLSQAFDVLPMAVLVPAAWLSLPLDEPPFAAI